eukprot:1145125-Pelagomonas_calceolata.AAC.2
MAEGGVVQARRHMAESPPDPHGSLLMTPGLDLARPQTSPYCALLKLHIHVSNLCLLKTVPHSCPGKQRLDKNNYAGKGNSSYSKEEKKN